MDKLRTKDCGAEVFRERGMQTLHLLCTEGSVGSLQMKIISLSLVNCEDLKALLVEAAVFLLSEGISIKNFPLHLHAVCLVLGFLPCLNAI